MFLFFVINFLMNFLWARPRYFYTGSQKIDTIGGNMGQYPV